MWVFLTIKSVSVVFLFYGAEYVSTRTNITENVFGYFWSLPVAQEALAGFAVGFIDSQSYSGFLPFKLKLDSPVEAIILLSGLYSIQYLQECTYTAKPDTPNSCTIK